MAKKITLTALSLILTASSLAAAADPPEVQRVGAGSYLTSIPPGGKGPKSEVTPDGNAPVPTNDWCSSLYWEKFSHPHFAHPLAMEARPEGLRVFYPGPGIKGTKDAIFGGMPTGKMDLVISHTDVPAFDAKDVWDSSDWFVVPRWKSDKKRLQVNYGHGSPYLWGWHADGEATITFDVQPKLLQGDEQSRALIFSVGEKFYGLFDTASVRWKGLGTKQITTGHKDRNYGFFTVAVLPDAEPQTIKLFTRFAYGLVAKSHTTYEYDPKSAVVTSHFFTETVYDEPPAKKNETLLALYPHQWRYAQDVDFTGHTYNSVRGLMKVARVPGEFKTAVKFPGILPALPRVPGGADPARIAAYIRQDIGPDDPGVHDTYGDGKLLGKWASLIPIAEQYGLTAEADLLTKRVKTRLEDWLTATDSSGKSKTKRVFAYDKTWGTLIGYPAGYGSDQELNDHHFHWGYFIRAAAEVARRDPAWAKDDRFGGMIKLLIRDIASPDRDDKLFPWLRNFDPYAGHSWASGHARFGDGNNNESSSEAMNAWYGMVLFGQATGDVKLRDLGIWLYTTEMTAIEDYWFGVHGDTFAKGYTASVVTMVWGGKGANGTWFSGEPEAVHGINFLPITGGSLYLGRYPDYVKKNWDAMLAERANKPARPPRRGGAAAAPAAPAEPPPAGQAAEPELRQWRDILLMYHALSDPADALKRFDAIAAQLKPEGGNTLANTYHWIATLNALGQVDRTVWADHPLAIAFVKDGKRMHVVYRSAGDAKMAVKFSDGVVIEAGKEGWTVK